MGFFHKLFGLKKKNERSTPLEAVEFSQALEALQAAKDNLETAMDILKQRVEVRKREEEEAIKDADRLAWTDPSMVRKRQRQAASIRRQYKQDERLVRNVQQNINAVNRTASKVMVSADDEKIKRSQALVLAQPALRRPSGDGVSQSREEAKASLETVRDLLKQRAEVRRKEEEEAINVAKKLARNNPSRARQSLRRAASIRRQRQHDHGLVTNVQLKIDSINRPKVARVFEN